MNNRGGDGGSGLSTQEIVIIAVVVAVIIILITLSPKILVSIKRLFGILPSFNTTQPNNYLSLIFEL